MAGHVYKMTFVESQRGCPRRCTYCCNTLVLNAYRDYRSSVLRKKSIPRVIEEMIHLKKEFGINFFQFTDDDFLLRKPAELREFRDLYLREVDLPFWCQAEANNVNDEKIRLIREAGCIAVSMGIETGSDFIREKVMKRTTKKPVTIEAFRVMHEHGIRTSGNVILGVPHESRAEIFETIEVVRQCRPSSLNVNMFVPYRGTELRDMAVELGFVSPDFLREGRISWNAILDMPQITKAEVEGLARTFVLYSYLPRAYWPEIRKCETPSPEADEIFGKLEAIYWEIAEEIGIDVDVPGFDYDGAFRARQQEIAVRGLPTCSTGSVSGVGAHESIA